jgi:microcystin-dependent protein
MPASYTKTGGQGHVYSVPDYPEAADGPKAFKDFADYLDLILPPVGTIMPFVGTTAPTGWLSCDGQEVSSTSFPKLAALCGTKFGTAAAGNFRLPSLKGRVVAGLDSSQTEFDTVGKTGGAKTVTLTTGNLPAHNHTATLSGLSLSGLAVGSESAHTHGAGTYATGGTGGHGHGMNIGTRVTAVTASTNTNTAGGGSLTRVSSIDVTSNSAATFTGSILGETDGGHSHSFSGTSGAGSTHTHTISGTISGGTIAVDNTGGGTSFSVLNPYLTLNHIIRAA